MHSILRLTLRAALLGVIWLAALPATGHARYGVRIGIGDQNATMFSDPLFRAADFRHVRYFVPWNATRHPAELLKAVDYVQRARRAGVSVTMHVSTDDLRVRRGHLPSTGAYRRYVGRLVRALRPLGVREWGVWNEANHASQPTWNHPDRAADYYRQMRSICRGCRIVALDVLDQRGVERYISRFYQALPKRLRRSARFVGVHNYGDVNRHRSTGFRSIRRAVSRYVHAPSFWLTETGGIVRLGRTFACSETRAASATRYLFKLLRTYRRDIDRAYLYNWYGADCATRMDTGLVTSDGQSRPAYRVVLDRLRQFKR